jgi:sulfide:quinone oxidoreductase
MPLIAQFALARRVKVGAGMKQIVILGAGTAGTMMANRLARLLPDAWRIVLLDRDDAHLYQPGLLFLPFGAYREAELVRPRTRLVDPRVTLRIGEIDRVAPDQRRVVLRDGEAIAYDFLVLATGSRILPASTPGLTGAGWRQTAFDFYTLDGARALRAAFDRFTAGRIVVDIAELPIKCPVAPLELLFLADAYFTQRGLRDRVELVLATPNEGAFTKPVASRMLGDMLQRRGIEVVGDFAISEVDGARRRITSYDGRQLDYDLLVSIPVHGGAELITRSGLGDANGWIPTDRETLVVKSAVNAFALGDATDLPSSKAGAVAHFQGDVLVQNLLAAIDDRPLPARFDGHANCFIETGYGKAMLIDFNYETEPLPGKYPLPGVGPFTLLGESATNHWGKLAFKWLYWNVIVAGKELPLDHHMSMAGKQAA